MKSKESFMTKTIVIWLGAMLSCALWGSAYPCIKTGYQMFRIPSTDTATQILFAGCRFTLAGILAILIGSVLNHKVLIPKKTSWGMILKLCMLQTVIQYLFFYIGLANTSGVKSSIIDGTNVFVAIFVACFLFHQETLTARKLIGSIIGFAGVILVNLTGGDISMSFKFTGEGFIFLSAIAYAFSSVCVKSYSRYENPVVLSGYQFVAGGLIMILAGLIMGGRLHTWSVSGVIMLLYLATISAVAYSLWGTLLKYNPVSRVAVFGFMNPVFGVVFSAIFLKEADTLGITSLISLILVCIGIYIVNRND